MLDLVISETHTGLKRVTHMFALSDACKYSLSKVPCLEQEEKIALTDQTWQLQKRNLKSELCCFKLNTLISSHSVCQMLANLKKRKRKLLSCVFTFHKTCNKTVSNRSLAVTAKKCTKKCDAHAKLLLNLLFRGCSEGFQIWFRKKNSQALNRSSTLQPLMSFWSINIACSISTLFDMLQKWVLIISAIS